MRIRDRKIDVGAPAYVIAELGVNHNGSASRAIQLVEAAARAGADAVKLQYFEAARLLSHAARSAEYQKRAGCADPREMLRILELSIDAMKPIVAHARALGLHAIATVFSTELVDLAEAIDWDAYKVASPDIIHRPLIQRLSETGRPLILSTGAATLEEVARAIAWIGMREHAFLQCVSAYPTPVEHAALDGIPALQRLGIERVGYSDHTESVDTGAEAVRRGAVILEKHLTHDRAARGPDHAASLDPAQFAGYVGRARAATFDSSLVTHPQKDVLPIEQDVRTVSRQSLTTTRPLRAGDVINVDDLTVKRPGSGIAPWRLDEIIGSIVAVDVAADMPLHESAIRIMRAGAASAMA